MDAKNANSAKDACKRLREVFGDDFPCPEDDGKGKEGARKTSGPAIVPSSSSACGPL